MITEEKTIREQLADAWDEGHIAVPAVVPSEFHEPPLGSWVKDKHGATSMRRIDADGNDGWGQPGFYSYGKWSAMWEARGPYVLCGPWGAPYQSPQNPYREAS